jgi:hypothetical protein
MDLSLALVGVLGMIGINLNKQVNSRDYTEKRTKIPDSEMSNGKNVYESRDFSRSSNGELRIAQKIRQNN